MGKKKSKFNIDDNCVRMYDLSLFLLIRYFCLYFSHHLFIIHNLNDIVVHFLKFFKFFFKLDHFVDEGRVVENFEHELIPIFIVLIEDVL